MWFWLIEVQMPDSSSKHIASNYCFARYEDVRRHYNDELDNLELYMEEQEVGEVLEISFIWVPNRPNWERHRWN